MRSKASLVGSALLVVAMAPDAPARAETGVETGGERRYAVIIGNNLGRPGDGELLYAHRDAQEFASVMRRSGGLVAENTMLLLGDSGPDIRRALITMNERIRQENDSSTSPSVLIVYYSGHADADGLHPGRETVAYSELRSLLRGSAATLRVLILDGCRSGEMTSVKGGRPTREFEISPGAEVRAEGVVMISSSAAGEDSHESSRLRASFFSHHFVNALVGAADDDGDGNVTLGEAYRYTYRNTLRASGRTSRLQHPTYSYDVKGRNDFAMTRLAPGDGAGRLRLAGAGTYLIYRDRDDGELVAEVNVLARGTLLSLPPDRYFVQQRAADHYLEYDVTLTGGRTIALERQPSRRVQYARLVRKGGDRTTSSLVYGRAGLRSELIEGIGPTSGAILGYQLDLRVLSVSLRGRLDVSQERALTSALRVRHVDWAVGVAAQRYFDLDAFSIGVGLLGEVVLHQQSFRGTAPAQGRRAAGLAFGALASIQREIGDRLAFNLEGGPVTHRFPLARTETGSEVGSSPATALAVWFAAGLGWMF
jgi:Caspase domain